MISEPWRNWKADEYQIADLYQFAAERGWAYNPRDEGPITNFVGEKTPVIRVTGGDSFYGSSRWGENAKPDVRHRVRGMVSGLQYECVQLTCLVGYDGKYPERLTYVVAMLQCDVKTDPFSVMHRDFNTFLRGLGRPKVKTSNPDFDRHFWVDATDIDDVERFLSPDVTSLLTSYLTGQLHRVPDQFTLIAEGHSTAEAVAWTAEFFEDMWAGVPEDMKA